MLVFPAFTFYVSRFTHHADLRIAHALDAHLLAAQAEVALSHFDMGLRLANVDSNRSTFFDPHFGQFAFSFIL